MYPWILAYLALTILRPQDYMPALAGVPLLSSVLVLAFLAWLGSRSKTFDAPHFWLLPVFLVVLMLSEVFSGWVGGAVAQLAQFGPTVAAFFVLASAIAADQRRVRSVFVVFALCATVLAVHGIDQKLHGVGWTGATMTEDGRIRYVGIFHDPNDLGLLFVTALPMAAYLSAGAGLFRRLFWLTCAGLLLYGVYLTNSRGAMLAVLVVGGGYIWYRRGLTVAGMLGVLGLAAMKLLSSRMQELDAAEDSAAGRVDAWYAGMHMFMSRPLFGVGADNFTDYNQLTAHNSFVLVLAETGFIGFLVWLAFVGYAFWMMMQIVGARTAAVGSGENGSSAQPAWENERRLALTMLLSLSGLFATAFFLSRSYTVVMYLVIAIVVGHYVELRRRYSGLRAFSVAQDAGRWLVIAIVAIVALFVVVKLLTLSE